MSELGGIALEEGKLDEATTHLEEAADIDRRAGDSRGLGVILNNLADVAWRERRMRAARDLLSQALGLSRQAIDQEGISLASINLGFIELLDDRVEQARLRVREGLSIAAGLNHEEAISYGLEAAADLAARIGMYQIAAELSGAADEMRKRSGLSLGTNESELHTERESRLRSALGFERYSAAMEKGRAMNAVEATNQALHLLDESGAKVPERDSG